MTLTVHEFSVLLKCDTPGCDGTLGHALGYRARPADCDQLRRSAFAAGWTRRRPRPNASLADFCPKCSEAPR